MVNEISISNYKSILRQQFSLGRINVFIGANGCGKTNILEAVGMAAAAHDDALAADNLWNLGIRVVKPPLAFHSSRVHPLNEVIEIAWRERHSWKKTKLVCDNPNEIFDPWKDISWCDPEYIDKLNDLIRFIGNGSVEEQYPFPDESKNALLSAAFRGSKVFRDYLNTVALRGYTIENRMKPLGVYGEGLDVLLSTFTKEQIQEIKSYGYISWLDDIFVPAQFAMDDWELERGKSDLHFVNKYMPTGSYCFSAENVNGGALHVLFYLVLLVSRRAPSFFAIDNIETLLAPSLCRDLMRTIVQLATKQNQQLLITTHHPAIFDGLDLTDPEQKLFEVKRADDHQTLVEEITDKAQVEI